LAGKSAGTVLMRDHGGYHTPATWVRDVDCGEGRSQVSAAAGPQIMASLRNLAITILRLAGYASIAAALRYHARRPDSPLRTIMINQALRRAQAQIRTAGKRLCAAQPPVDHVRHGLVTWGLRSLTPVG
jgi:hypothetical protein